MCFELFYKVHGFNVRKIQAPFKEMSRLLYVNVDVNFKKGEKLVFIIAVIFDSTDVNS